MSPITEHALDLVRLGAKPDESNESAFAIEVVRLYYENHRLTAALKSADLQHIRLRTGLREALDLLVGATMSTDAYDSRIDDLRKLLGGEP